MNIYFLGGGNMAAAIAGGLVRQGGHRVHIANRGKEKHKRLAAVLSGPLPAHIMAKQSGLKPDALANAILNRDAETVKKAAKF